MRTPEVPFRILMTVFAVLAAIVIHVLNVDPQFYIIHRYLRFMQVLTHEFGHAFASFISGGSVFGIIVQNDGGGLTYTGGGNIDLILIGGYMGSSLIGSVCFYFNNRYQVGPAVAYGIGIVIVIFSVLFGKVDPATGLPLTIITTVVFGVILYAVGKWAPWYIGVFLINTLSAFVIFDALQDLNNLVLFSEQSHHNDAVGFSHLHPILTGNQWAMFGVLIAFIFFSRAFYFGVIKPLRQSLTKAK